MNPFTLLISGAGWMNRNQQDAIAYLQEEIRILKGTARQNAQIRPIG